MLLRWFVFGGYTVPKKQKGQARDALGQKSFFQLHIALLTRCLLHLWQNPDLDAQLREG